MFRLLGLYRSWKTRKILEFDFYIKVKFGVMKKIDLSPGKVLEICL